MCVPNDYMTNKFTINYKLKCERHDNTIELDLYNESIHQYVQHYIISLHKLMDKTILANSLKMNCLIYKNL